MVWSWGWCSVVCCFVFLQAQDGIRDGHVTGVQTCALPISTSAARIVSFSLSSDTNLYYVTIAHSGDDDYSNGVNVPRGDEIGRASCRESRHSTEVVVPRAR